MAAPVGRTARRSASPRKPREQRWAELIDVATHVFYEKGYDGASLQDIADRIGMLKGSLYYYIESKEELLFEVISAVHGEGLALIARLAEGDEEPLERLERVIRGHVERTCNNLVPVAVFLHELQALPEERQKDILGGDHSYQSVFRDLIDEAAANGDLRDGVDPRLASRSILGSANWVYRWFRPDGAMDPEIVGAQIAELAVASVASPAALARRAER